MADLQNLAQMQRNWRPPSVSIRGNRCKGEDYRSIPKETPPDPWGGGATCYGIQNWTRPSWVP